MTNADVYNGFLDALNRQDLAAAEKCVDVVAYRENCVGFTPGWIAWPQSCASITTIWKAIPDLHVEIHNIAETADAVLARGTVSGARGAASTARRPPSAATRPASSTTSCCARD